MTVSGIDIASYQSSTFDTAGLAFVMVKATEGAGYVNPRHADQVAHARAHGLVVGHYHFARPGDMATQVRYFLAHAAVQPGDVLALDWEDTGVSSADKDAFLRALQQAAPGHRVVLYCNLDFWLHHDDTGFCGDGLWIADPGAPAGHPRVTHPWVFHQYGIRGADLDVANFPTAAALRAWAAGTTTSTQEDSMPTAEEIAAAVWNHTETTTPGTKPVRMGAVVGWLDVVHGNQNTALATAVAELGALKAAVAALTANGGLTAEQITAASEAGARAALAELGTALTNPTGA